MKSLLILMAAGLLLLTGCLPNTVSVSKDGTIALTLSETGEYSLIQGDREQVYLTNASADFLEKVEGLEECRMPVISPSGRYVLACSEKELLLHDRETKRTRAIYRERGGSDSGMEFPVWSPDERKIAFFGQGLGVDDTPALCVYDVKRRELEVLVRNASPQAAWLPDSKRLLYISLAQSVFDDGGVPFGDLNMIQVSTHREKTLARGQVFWLSGVSVFPKGNAVLFPCADWEGVEIVRTGMSIPMVLRKELLPAANSKTAPQPAAQRESVPGAAATESHPGGGQSVSVPAEPKERSFKLEKGQPIFPLTCAVSPDGTRIAYVRCMWDSGVREGQSATSEAETNELDDDTESPEGLECCVARGDGTGIVSVLRCGGEDNAQVLWVNDSRLLWVTEDGIIAVDADGQNKVNLIESIQTKFPDQFKREEKQETEEVARAST